METTPAVGHIPKSSTFWRRLVLLCIVFAMAGCAGNCVLRSETHIPNTKATTSFNVLYIERNLTSDSPPPKAIVSPVNETIAKFGYFEIGPKLKEFAPPLFKANGLSGTAAHIPSSQEQAASPFRNTLVLEFRQGQILKQGGVNTVTMMLNATLYDLEGTKRVWSGQFWTHLGDDPGLGVLKTATVNQQFIEGVLAMVLEQMAKDKVIALPGEKIILLSSSQG